MEVSFTTTSFVLPPLANFFSFPSTLAVLGASRNVLDCDLIVIDLVDDSYWSSVLPPWELCQEFVMTEFPGDRGERGLLQASLGPLLRLQISDIGTW